MTKHTATPWRIEELKTIDLNNIRSKNFAILANKGRIALLGSNKEENAKHIVHCINMHDELISALEELMEQYAQEGKWATQTNAYIKADQLLLKSKSEAI